MCYNSIACLKRLNQLGTFVYVHLFYLNFLPPMLITGIGHIHEETFTYSCSQNIFFRLQERKENIPEQYCESACVTFGKLDEIFFSYFHNNINIYETSKPIQNRYEKG